MGRDLIAAGMKPGPAMGKALASLYEAQLDGKFFDLAGGLKLLKEDLGHQTSEDSRRAPGP